MGSNLGYLLIYFFTLQDLLKGKILFLIRLTYRGGANALPAPLIRPALNMMLIWKLPLRWFLIILTSQCNEMVYSFLKYFFDKRLCHSQNICVLQLNDDVIFLVFGFFNRHWFSSPDNSKNCSHWSVQKWAFTRMWTLWTHLDITLPS